MTTDFAALDFAALELRVVAQLAAMERGHLPEVERLADALQKMRDLFAEIAPFGGDHLLRLSDLAVKELRTRALHQRLRASAMQPLQRPDTCARSIPAQRPKRRPHSRGQGRA